VGEVNSTPNPSLHWTGCRPPVNLLLAKRNEIRHPRIAGGSGLLDEFNLPIDVEDWQKFSPVIFMTGLFYFYAPECGNFIFVEAFKK